MAKIEIIESFSRFRKGQIVELDDFDTGHALAFKYGRLYASKPVETQVLIQPETREVEIEQAAPEQVIIKVDKNQSFFKRRGRPKK